MKLYGLIGKNIGYSFSRKYFSEKFEKEKIPAAYRNFDLPDISYVEQVFQNTPNLRGLNVTIPYKQDVIPFLDEMDRDAQKIGAVNTIKIENNKKTGYNTDFIGFRDSLVPLLKPHHKKALILGTGGASKAVAYTFVQLGIEYKFVSRAAKSGGYTYDQVDKKILEEHTIIVNCTPLGTFPNIDDHPAIPYQFITPEHLVYDLIYNPETTSFMAKAAQNGAVTLNGLKMLQGQAEAAWKIWNS